MSELPEDVRAVLSSLVAAQAPLHIAVRPWDAWVAVACLQFSSRNPQISAAQRDQIIAVGRALQLALTAMAPQAARYLEDGWNPANDVPREREDNA